MAKIDKLIYIFIIDACNVEYSDIDFFYVVLLMKL